MSDVRDILGLNSQARKPGASSSSTSSSSSSSAIARKPSNVPFSQPPPPLQHQQSQPSSSSSSLSSVPASNLASLAVDNVSWNKAKAKSGLPLSGFRPLKDILKAKHKKAVQWKLLPIRSSARAQNQLSAGRNGEGSVDDVDLFHWVKFHNVPDYRFSKFNKKIKLLEFSNEEYQNYLQDPDWSQEQTQLLFDFCKQFDLRFIIIADRFNEQVELLRQQWKEQKQKENADDKSEKEEQKEEKTTIPTISVSAPPAASSSSMDISLANDNEVKVKTEEKDGKAEMNEEKSIINMDLVSEEKQPSAAPAPNPAEEYGGNVFRTVEQLKGRFYSIQCKLLSLRNSSDPELKKHPLFVNSYNEQYEAERKNELLKLYQRTQAQIDSMANIVLEHRKLNSQIKKIKSTAKEQKGELAKGGIKGMDDKSKQKRKNKLPLSGVGPAGGAAGGGFPFTGEMAPIPDHCVPGSGAFPEHKEPVYLRSTQLNAPLNLNAKQSKSLEAELNAFNFKKAKEIIPTSPVCELYDKLRMDIVTLQNLQKYISEREALRDQLRQTIPNSAAILSANNGGAAVSSSQASSMHSSSSSTSLSLMEKSKKHDKGDKEKKVKSEDKKKEKRKKEEGEDRHGDAKRRKK